MMSSALRSHRRRISLRVALILICVTFLAAGPADAQKSKSKKSTARTSSPAESPGNEQKVRDMIAFLQYVLNTLGSSETGARDKEILVTESYSKIFRDATVQVEDDLDERRSVITNKDVVAYLKDVDFFFQDVKFELEIEEIEGNTLPSGTLFYKVTLARNLGGTTSDGRAVNNTIPRFIEINLNPETQDLKIVSMYTNEFDEREALTSWWDQLSFEWQSIFKKTLDIEDSVLLDDIKDMTAIEEMDLSGNSFIQTIEPLAALAGLKSLNLAGTRITDLVPIRNLTGLRELNISNTPVSDLSPLKYFDNIISLDISGSAVRDVSVIEKMSLLRELRMARAHILDLSPLGGLTSLVFLDLQSTPVRDLSAIGNLDQLMELNVANTAIGQLDALKNFKSLRRLNIDSTAVAEISALATTDSLKVLEANHTPVSDLQPMAQLPLLEKIYCDQSNISRAQANAFMAANPGVLVVYDSKDLMAWWGTLPNAWKKILSTSAKTGINPSKEDLVMVTNVDSINFGGNTSINDLEPLRKLLKLRVLVAANSSITTLEPLENHKDITFLDVSGTKISDLSLLEAFTKLTVLKADNSGIEEIAPLHNLENLEKLYVDGTYVHDIIAREFLEKNSDCLIVYKTSHLNRWWRNVTGYWIKVFQTQMADTSATRENLHRLVERETLEWRDIPVRDLAALGEFVRLKHLRVSGAAVTAIPPLENLRDLESLQISNGPLQDIDALALFDDLRSLDISNTAVTELDPLGTLHELRVLRTSGTQIKKLNPLETLEELVHLDCSNTAVRNLEPVTGLALETLKCYNTRLSRRKVAAFAEQNPSCEIVFF